VTPPETLSLSAKASSDVNFDEVIPPDAASWRMVNTEEYVSEEPPARAFVISAAMPGSVIVGAGDGEGEGEGEGDGEGLGFECPPPPLDLLEPPTPAIFEAPNPRESGDAPNSKSAPWPSHRPSPQESTGFLVPKWLRIEEDIFWLDTLFLHIARYYGQTSSVTA
jgi:hypothetical protein